MTEGLIQKVFRIFEARLALRMKPYNATKKDWLALEQDLIVAIKTMTFTHASSEWIKYLIGDQK